MEGGLDEHSRSALRGISEYLVHGFAQAGAPECVDTGGCVCGSALA